MKKGWIAGMIGTLLVLSAAGPVQAQVRFETASTDVVRRMAQQQNKLVFIDLYATWCGPCRTMERNVFAKKEAGDFMEKYFVAAKYDVDQSVGRALMSEYGRGAIPLYLIFDTEGTLWGTIEGSAPLDVFLKNLQAVVDRYKAGQRPTR